jgi:hypothetical protein
VLEVEQEIEIKASIVASFEGLLRQLTSVHTMAMKIERFPGGRWYRDLGNEAGHLWGFVQVIKPPTLLEIHGPMMMSYPATNHVQIRLREIEGGTLLTLRHRAFGLIEEAHRQGVAQGWLVTIQGVEAIAQSI